MIRTNLANPCQALLFVKRKSWRQVRASYVCVRGHWDSQVRRDSERGTQRNKEVWGS